MYSKLYLRYYTYLWTSNPNTLGQAKVLRAFRAESFGAGTTLKGMYYFLTLAMYVAATLRCRWLSILSPRIALIVLRTELSCMQEKVTVYLSWKRALSRVMSSIS